MFANLFLYLVVSLHLRSRKHATTHKYLPNAFRNLLYLASVEARIHGSECAFMSEFPQSHLYHNCSFSQTESSQGSHRKNSLVHRQYRHRIHTTNQESSMHGPYRIYVLLTRPSVIASSMCGAFQYQFNSMALHIAQLFSTFRLIYKDFRHSLSHLT